MIGRHLTLKQQGREQVGICPFHNDEKASLKVNEGKQIYKCFACGAGGDAIDFLVRLGASFPEACDEIQNQSGFTVNPEQRLTAKQIRAEWNQIKPVPATAPSPPKHYRLGNPNAKWEYRDTQGALLGYVCRFNTREGKEVMPLIYATDGIRSEWRWQGFDKPRPLWNLEEITRKPEQTVVIFEGEKTAEAGSRLLPGYTATTWIGGARSIKATDWRPLIGRKVIFWPDNDKEFQYPETHEKKGELLPFEEQPGNAAMIDIYNILSRECPGARWIQNPPDAPNKWDIADADWNMKQATEYLMTHQLHPITWEPVPGKKTKKDSTKPTDEVNKELNGRIEISESAKAELVEHINGKSHPDAEEPEQDPPAINYKEHFSFLGYTKTESGTQSFHFFVFAATQSLNYAANQMTTNNLMTLAPLNFWKKTFPGAKAPSEFSLGRAVNWLIIESNKIGVFSPDKVRGRGAWMDDDRVIIHAGDHLIVDKKSVELGEFDTTYVYEQELPIDIKVIKEATVEESSKILELFSLLNWEREVNAKLLAGWCVIAPVCGALKWRPHIWVTGSAGCGKTFVFSEMVRPLLGNTCLTVQSLTTEAGLRAMLGRDALPIVFDEAEAEDKKNQDRMASILGLMRAASAEDGGIIAKGTSSGNARLYRIRSCFAFASISMQIQHQSDRSRVTVLGMRSPTGKEKDPVRIKKWKDLTTLKPQILTDEFSERLISRTINLLPIINKNARIFAETIYKILGDQRTSDQLAYLLAGAWSLQSDLEVTHEQAEEFTKLEDWSEEEGLKDTRDELECFQFIINQEIRIETGSGPQTRTVGELVGIAAKLREDSIIVESKSAKDRLYRMGIKIDKQATSLIISNTSTWINELLDGTAWARNYHKTLERIPDSRALKNYKFLGYQSRAVSIPLEILGFNEPDEEPEEEIKESLPF